MEGDANGRLLRMIERVERWCDASPRRTDAPWRTADRSLLDQALALVRQAAGRDRADAGAARRYDAAGAIAAALEPMPPRPLPAVSPLLPALERLQARGATLQAHTTVGQVRRDSLDGLDTLLSDYAHLMATAAATDPIGPYVAFFAAGAAFALGRGRALDGELARAAAAWHEAARLYGAAGEPDQAQAARDAAADAAFAARADVDGASLADLARLADGVDDPVDRARALFRLADRAREANDGFNAAARAEAGLDALAAAGFPEPTAEGWPAATACWIEAAFGRAPGAVGLRLLLWAGTAMLRAWMLRRAAADGPAADDGAASERMTAWLHWLLAEQETVAMAIKDGLRRYGLHDDEPSAPDLAGTARATALLRRIDAATDPADAQTLVADAQAIGEPLLVGQAWLALALLHEGAGDAAATLAAAEAGEAAILPEAGAQALIGLPTFDVLVELRHRRMTAAASTGDTDAVFACAWATISLIEAARYRISDPAAQAAFLRQRIAFYELAAFAAFKLDRPDDLLAATDLFKARAVLRNRLAPEPDAGVRALAARLDTATRDLAAAPPAARPALADRRQAIWDLLAVARNASAGGEALPVPGVAAIQAQLAAEEAVVSWAFVAPGILLVAAITPTGFHAERVILTDDQCLLLDQYGAAIGAGQARSRALGRTISALAAAVLPPATLAFVAGATRLILSPHRQLALLPLHAARLGDAYLIERASVRYVPNLASLLLPARGGGTGLVAVGVDRSRVPGWPPLRHAEAEARAVAQAWMEAGVPVACLLGDAATLDAIRAHDLSRARVIHLATHGSSVLAGEARDDPFASHLVLADGLLDARTVSQLSLAAELVVMSACHSGQRSLALRGLPELPGDDLFGLQAAFLQAGAQNVIGALWPLPDAAAARILPAVHAGLARGVAPDIALGEALRRELASPATADVYAWGGLFMMAVGRAAGGHG